MSAAERIVECYRAARGSERDKDSSWKLIIFKSNSRKLHPLSRSLQLAALYRSPVVRFSAASKYRSIPALNCWPILISTARRTNQFRLPGARLFAPATWVISRG
jgi:hypothetical protein